ncbi:MAG: ATP-binding protein [bacterium]
MADGLVVLDADGRVLVYSPPAEALLGLPSGRLAVGARLDEVALLPGLLVALDARRAAATASDDTAAALGPPRTVVAELTRLPAAPGGAASVLIVLRDARQVAQLQSLRRDFMVNVSQEMRTPLAAIRGASATLLAGALGDGERAHHFVDVIEQHAVRLGQLLADVACLADLEHGDLPIYRRPLSAASVLSNAVDAARDAALSAGVGLVWVVAPDAPALDGDRDLLDHVLLRLLDNAVRFAPRGATVTVSAGATPAPGGGRGAWVRLAVADRGAGPVPDELPSPSERSGQADHARARELGGSGLGLAVVKHIVRAHGGVMEIASALEHGTSTTLLWPASEPEAAPAVARPSAALQGAER